jgi:hypothetical protein
LRTKLRPFQRKRFFATCWLIVLAPRRRSPSSASAIASWIASTSKPWWYGNFWSSAATSAIGSCFETRSHGVQR